MTHYTINYAGMNNHTAREKAIADIKDYIGEDCYNKITNECKNSPALTWDQWRMAMFLSGVEGFPLQVWYDTIWPEA